MINVISWVSHQAKSSNYPHIQILKMLKAVFFDERNIEKRERERDNHCKNLKYSTCSMQDKHH
jgi:hypothetical protein